MNKIYFIFGRSFFLGFIFLSFGFDKTFATNPNSVDVNIESSLTFQALKWLNNIIVTEGWIRNQQNNAINFIDIFSDNEEPLKNQLILILKSLNPGQEDKYYENLLIKTSTNNSFIYKLIRLLLFIKTIDDSYNLLNISSLLEQAEDPENIDIHTNSIILKPQEEIIVKDNSLLKFLKRSFPTVTFKDDDEDSLLSKLKKIINKKDNLENVLTETLQNFFCTFFQENSTSLNEQEEKPKNLEIFAEFSNLFGINNNSSSSKELKTFSNLLAKKIIAEASNDENSKVTSLNKLIKFIGNNLTKRLNALVTKRSFKRSEFKETISQPINFDDLKDFEKIHDEGNSSTFPSIYPSQRRSSFTLKDDYISQLQNLYDLHNERYFKSSNNKVFILKELKNLWWNLYERNPNIIQQELKRLSLFKQYILNKIKNNNFEISLEDNLENNNDDLELRHFIAKYILFAAQYNLTEKEQDSKQRIEVYDNSPQIKINFGKIFHVQLIKIFSQSEINKFKETVQKIINNIIKEINQVQGIKIPLHSIEIRLYGSSIFEDHITVSQDKHARNNATIHLPISLETVSEMLKQQSKSSSLANKLEEPLIDDDEIKKESSANLKKTITKKVFEACAVPFVHDLKLEMFDSRKYQSKDSEENFKIYLDSSFKTKSHTSIKKDYQFSDVYNLADDFIDAEIKESIKRLHQVYIQLDPLMRRAKTKTVKDFLWTVKEGWIENLCNFAFYRDNNNRNSNLIKDYLDKNLTKENALQSKYSLDDGKILELRRLLSKKDKPWSDFDKNKIKKKLNIYEDLYMFYESTDKAQPLAEEVPVLVKKIQENLKLKDELEKFIKNKTDSEDPEKNELLDKKVAKEIEGLHLYKKYTPA